MRRLLTHPIDDLKVGPTWLDFQRFLSLEIIADSD
jgi:hypothetical protein